MKLNINDSKIYFPGYINVCINDSDVDSYDYNLKELFKIFTLQGLFSEIIIEDFVSLLKDPDFINICANLKYLLPENGKLKILQNQQSTVGPILSAIGFNNVEYIKDYQGNKKPEKSDKIPCFVLIFHDYDIIKKSLDCLVRFSQNGIAKNADKLDLIVVENKSDNTEEKIKPYVTELLNSGKISKYYLFDENISGKALSAAIYNELPTILNSSYMITTDGDLTINNDNWIAEEKEILEKNPEVFACGMEMELCNLPSEELFPNAKNWVPKARVLENKNYNEGLTGCWFLMQKCKDWLKASMAIRSANAPCLDSSSHNYCYKIEHKIWARTKNSKGYHLTWDAYNNPEHPYSKWKRQFSFDELWKHNKNCGYKLYIKK